MSLDQIKPLVVSFDIGGSEMLLRYLKKINIKSFYLIANKNIKSKFIKSDFDITSLPYKKLDKIKFSKIFLSTGYTTDIEKNIIKKFKNIVPTISVIDHWSSYKERFTIKDKLYLPDKIIFPDKYSIEIFKKKIKRIEKTKLLLIRGMYKEDIDDFNKKKNKLKIQPKNVFLFIDVQTKSHYKRKINKNLYEKNVFLEFYKKVKKNFSAYKIIIRLHPNEKNNKYLNFSKNDRSISISKNKNLNDDLVKSNFIVGIDSMALYKAYICKKYILFPLDKSFMKYSHLPIKKKFILFEDMIN